VRGTIAFVFGVTLLAADANLSRLTTFAAVYWILAALLTLHWAGAHRALTHRGITFAAAVTALVVGIVVMLRALFKALLSQGEFLDFLGVSALAIGLLRLLGMIHDDALARDHPRRRYRFVVGALEVLLGIALVVADTGGSTQTRIALGVWGLATGTFLILDAFMVRRFSRAGAGRAT
jgi:hypothetical protein